jgi:hypothetical protein
MTTTQCPETWTSSGARFRENWKRLSLEEKQIFLASLKAREIEALETYWELFCHAHQTAPPGDWSLWLLLGGRGAGKTRTGAEWVRGLACGSLHRESVSPIALVGETEHDVREVMIEGVSGILAAKGRSGFPRAVGSNGRTVSWRRPSPPRIPTSSAARSLPLRGATSSPSGVTQKRRSTCCSSDCVSANVRAS